MDITQQETKLKVGTVAVPPETSGVPEENPLPQTFSDEASYIPLDPSGTHCSDNVIAATAVQKSKDESSCSDLNIVALADLRRSGGNRQKVARPPASARSKTLKSEDLLMTVPTPPWVPLHKVYPRHPMEALKEEINDFTAFMMPTVAEHSMRRLCIDRIAATVRRVWPLAEVRVFGSFETKLYLPSSDLDLVVLYDKASVPRSLHTLANALRQDRAYDSITVISKAKVPIIKLTDLVTQYKVDISFNTTNGLASAEIIKDFGKDPQCGAAFKSLILLLKQFLVQRNLNEPYMGGLGSYALSTMIAAFLKLHPKLAAGLMKSEDNIGPLFLEFFEFYGRFLYNKNVGVAVHVQYGAWLFRRAEKGWHPTNQESISIVDPQDSENDIGRQTFAYRIVRAEFYRAFLRITSMIATWYHREQRYQEHRYKNRDSRAGPDRPARLNTVLGVILSVSTSVLAQRELIEERYSKIISPTNGLEVALADQFEVDHKKTKTPKISQTVDNDRDVKDVTYVEYDSADDDDRMNLRAPFPGPSHRKRGHAGSHNCRLYSSNDSSIVEPEYCDGDMDLVDMLRQGKRHRPA
ncbi:hypothetical protein SeLEV6574_g00483 [Synchytrium endobioticum]|nr:hypothetical protein SeLEV6574_g00483 [Synchytrium endobioticum]